MARNLTVRQVAEIFDVHPNTIVDWTNKRPPLLRCSFTAGGHRRFDPIDVERKRVELANRQNADDATDAA